MEVLIILNDAILYSVKDNSELPKYQGCQRVEASCLSPSSSAAGGLSISEIYDTTASIS